MTEHQQHTATAIPKLFAGLAGMAKNLFALGVSRIELAALELADIRTNLLKLLLVSAIGLIAAWFALLFWAGLLVVLTWDSLGWKIFLIIAAVFTLIVIAIAFYVRSMLTHGKLSMPATLAELRSDRDALL